MIKNREGGSNTNKSGKPFEKLTSIKNVFANDADYCVDMNELYYKGNLIGTFYEQGDINTLIKKLKLNKNIWSCGVRPDSALYVPSEKTIYVSEAKNQKGDGSVDFKPWGFPGLKWKYENMFNSGGINVKFCCVLSNHFKKNKFDDMFEYLTKENVQYFFNKIDKSWFNFIGCEYKTQKRITLW